MTPSRRWRQVESENPPAGQRLAEVFSQQQPELLGMLYYLIGNVEDAKAALQDAYTTCLQHLERMAEVGNLQTWVFQMALGAGRDGRAAAWRRRRRPLELIEASPPVGRGDAKARAARQKQMQGLRSVLLDLRAEEQEVFLLRQNAHMTYEQIAHVMNLPVGTVKTRMRLAITKLSASLAVESEPPPPVE